jgi:hypothetical protein
MGRRRVKAKDSGLRLQDEPVVSSRYAAPPWIAVAGAALFVIACAVHLWLQDRAYPDGVPQFWLRGGIAVALGAALVASLPLRVLRDLPARCGALLMRPSPAVFAAIVAATTIGLSILFALYAFERFATTADEMAQLWHAKMLVHGYLSLPADPHPEFFAIDNVIDTGRWYSEYPIGGPAVLAVGVLLGLPWLVNPVLAGLAAAALYHFARRAYGEIQGRAVAALFSVTPMVVMMSGSYMNHVPVLCLAACALAALVEWEGAPSRRRAAVCAAAIGVALGAMATIRPLDAAVVAVVVGAFQLSVVVRDRTRLRGIAIQAVCGAVAVAPLLYANRATTGNALRFGYDVLWGAGHQIGFHADPTGAVHTVRRGVEYAVMYVSEINIFAMIWPVPALLAVVASLLAMRRATRWDVLLLGLFWAQVVAYGAYWHQGQFLGPRFLFTALPTIVVLIARMPFLAGDRFPGFGRRAALLFTLACLAGAWCVPAQQHGVWAMARAVRNSRRVLKADLAGAVRDANVHRALVFLREPFGVRLRHRLWGVGMPRSDAAILFARSDACSLLAAVRAAESDSSTPRVAKIAGIARATARYVPGDSAIRVTDPTVRISSGASIAVPCQAEIDADAKLGGAALGPALALEPISADGRIDGDVIYVADLGERNVLLRERFADRTWYRLTVVRPGDRTLRPVVVPY